MQIWSINYWLHLSRYKKIVYIGRYSILTYIEIFFLIVCCFFSYICRSVNCMSWVSKFNYFFLTCTEIEARFIFEGFMYCPLWKVHFQCSDTFFHFFCQVCKLFKGLFQPRCQSVNLWLKSLNRRTCLAEVQWRKH